MSASIATDVESEREFALTAADAARLRRLVRTHSGINLSETKQDLLYSRLVRRLRTLGLDGFGPYCDLLEREGGEELERFVNAITTNLTAFFREPHHFEWLQNVFLPEIARTRAGVRRLRVWSAGCSSGEEPYSIAMAILERGDLLSGWDVRILATDLDSEMVACGAAGVYPEDRVEAVGAARLSRWFLRGRGRHAGRVRVRDGVRDLVRFRKLNLMHEWPMRGPFDLVFCRNVVIYFDKETQRALFERIAGLTAPDGALCIGHSESLFNVTDRFRLVGKTVYRPAR